MKKFAIFFLSIKLFALSSPMPGMMGQDQKMQITNKVLVNVMNKPISVLDVVKKMNVILEENYPEYKNIKEARFQFYKQNWKGTLMQMIDSELMLKDAEKLELKVTDAEVREELYNRFGPNIMKSLNEIGITYDEAKKMIHTDFITQRMMWYRVQSKAFSNVGPDEVKKQYAEYLKKNPKSHLWTYEVLTVKSQLKELSTSAAQKAFNLLSASKAGLKEVATTLKNDPSSNNNLQITVSELLTAKEYELSESHKSVLKTLKEGDFSPPVEQISRNGKEKVFRVFHLVKQDTTQPESFHSFAEHSKYNLIQEYSQEFNRNYVEKLREKYGFKDLSFLEKLEPFGY